MTFFCFQSQEVTYAELTLPRKQGYTILRRVSPSSATTPTSSSTAAVVGPGPLSTSSSSSAGPSVIYARIEKPQQPLSLLVAPHGMTTGLGSAPLESGGGVSPSSFMNTSCDSSTSSATTTRVGIHQKTRYTVVSYIQGPHTNPR